VYNGDNDEIRRDTMYQSIIRKELVKNGYIGLYDPRHIEGYMRLEHGTLDGLSRKQRREEIEISRQCVDHGGIINAETLARSYGL
jgi:hypothetical protein